MDYKSSGHCCLLQDDIFKWLCLLHFALKNPFVATRRLVSGLDPANCTKKSCVFVPICFTAESLLKWFNTISAVEGVCFVLLLPE